jgi:hypothetical protein
LAEFWARDQNLRGLYVDGDPADEIKRLRELLQLVAETAEIPIRLVTRIRAILDGRDLDGPPALQQQPPQRPVTPQRPVPPPQRPVKEINPLPKPVTKASADDDTRADDEPEPIDI